MNRWLWNEADIQEDILVLQDKYKEMGYSLTKEQAYDAWYMYSESCYANWLHVSGDVSQSLRCVKKVLEAEGKSVEANDQKEKIRIEVCLNSNQPPNTPMTEYNFYVYDENNEEILSLYEDNQLTFQVEDRIERLKKEYELTDVVWLDLNGQRMK
ncbi:hypothetical protein PP175_27905 (plasmid) [Aneurinibacillus sp. Ricciae_BoGa-3]|uniref:hypothetical protein n=1 Tax=Aneurinibacillus sp. Ricciae_BoGa-3 TaxID=3022697 RepID=UPI00234181B8|nr:hypothetical protein [Aneurinibacillus sp. Ricciae_BoGa-3]WCK57017.1 hypothetical protein PP175_27905 [Aneurinibacillus sp. Ricciae_BoGa-3]